MASKLWRFRWQWRGVHEWTSSKYGYSDYVFRGGCWAKGVEGNFADFRASWKDRNSEEVRNRYLGFRCARTP